MTGPVAYSPNRMRDLAEACGTDFGRLAFDGFGIMLSDEQLEAQAAIGQPGPRRRGESKYNWLSGGQRSGKTVFGFLTHADACLYKRGVDTTSRQFWRNYQYGTLAIAPQDALTLRLWLIGDEISKSANDAQFDRGARRSRGGAFLGRFKATKDSKGNGIWLWTNGAHTDFRSSEGYAVRLEGGQWWWITWDEWASQPDREIHKIKSDILLGRSRDHDAKIMPMAWPKPETEHHLIAVDREIAAGRDLDSKIVYMSASAAFFTNREALAVELRTKTTAEIKRTILGKPAGGASKEFKPHVVDNMVKIDLPRKALPEEGYAYFSSWDLGATVDSTVGSTFRIPIIGGRRIVTPRWKARIVAVEELPGSDARTIGDISYAIAANRALYNATSAADATGMGGVFAVRELRDMRPKLLEFKSRGNDRVWGNMRLAAITNALDCLSWGYNPDFGPDAQPEPWGLVECPRILELQDQLANFDRDAKNVPDDWVWSFIIGLWYIRRYWAIGAPGLHLERSFDIRGGSEEIVLRSRRGARDQRSRLIGPPVAAVTAGVRFVRPRARDE